MSIGRGWYEDTEESEKVFELDDMDGVKDIAAGLLKEKLKEASDAMSENYKNNTLVGICAGRKYQF